MFILKIKGLPNMEHYEIKNALIGLIFILMGFRLRSKYTKKKANSGEFTNNQPSGLTKFVITMLLVCGLILILMSLF